VESNGRRNKNRLFIFCGVELKKTAEQADIGKNGGIEGLLDQLFDTLDGLVAFFDADAGILVTDLLAQRRPPMGKKGEFREYRKGITAGGQAVKPGLFSALVVSIA
jgi:hypothetical protein